MTVAVCNVGQPYQPSESNKDRNITVKVDDEGKPILPPHPEDSALPTKDMQDCLRQFLTIKYRKHRLHLFAIPTLTVIIRILC